MAPQPLEHHAHCRLRLLYLPLGALRLHGGIVDGLGGSDLLQCCGHTMAAACRCKAGALGERRTEHSRSGEDVDRAGRGKERQQPIEQGADVSRSRRERSHLLTSRALHHKREAHKDTLLRRRRHAGIGTESAQKSA